jgi:hypothetical protein
MLHLALRLRERKENLERKMVGVGQCNSGFRVSNLRGDIGLAQMLQESIQGWWK